jgi:hypothetical protein
LGYGPVQVFADGGSAWKAIEALAKAGTPPAVVVSDGDMLRVSGIDTQVDGQMLAEATRAKLPSVPIVIQTGRKTHYLAAQETAGALVKDKAEVQTAEALAAAIDDAQQLRARWQQTHAPLQEPAWVATYDDQLADQNAAQTRLDASAATLDAMENELFGDPQPVSASTTIRQPTSLMSRAAPSGGHTSSAIRPPSSGGSRSVP